MKERSDRLEIDFQKLLMTCLHRWWLIVAAAVVCGLVTLLISASFVVPMYQAQVKVYVNNSRADQQIEYITNSNLATAQRLVNTYITIIETDTVLEEVAEHSGLNVTADRIRKMMVAEQVGDTEVFAVTITHPDPEKAARLANAIAEVAPDKIGEFVEGSSTKIIDYAKVPVEPSSPSCGRNTLLGALVGAVAAVLYLTLRLLLDVRIRDEEDLLALFDLPVLAQIPAFAAEGNKRRGYGRGRKNGYRCDAAAASVFEDDSVSEERSNLLFAERDFFVREAYKTLRTNVSLALAGEEDCKVIVVTSALKGEGKSVTALNLAISYAMTDRKVLMIDCDLRWPKLARLLGVDGQIGLKHLILDAHLQNEAILPTRVQGLDIIPAGDIPSNPSELLGSLRMERIVQEMRREYDVIILDSPPVNMVTDAVVLAAQSDGVLFVARANCSERDAVVRAVEQVEYAKTKVLGFVLNDVNTEKPRCSRGRYCGKRYNRRRRCDYGYSAYDCGCDCSSRPPVCAKPSAEEMNDGEV